MANICSKLLSLSTTTTQEEEPTHMNDLNSYVQLMKKFIDKWKPKEHQVERLNHNMREQPNYLYYNLTQP